MHVVKGYGFRGMRRHAASGGDLGRLLRRTSARYQPRAARSASRSAPRSASWASRSSRQRRRACRTSSGGSSRPHGLHLKGGSPAHLFHPVENHREGGKCARQGGEPSKRVSGRSSAPTADFPASKPAFTVYGSGASIGPLHEPEPPRWVPGAHRPLTFPCTDGSIKDGYMETDDGAVAERQGFEPWRRLPAYTRSRRAPSTTRPPLRRRGS